ncbi:glycosyltransferase family 2 protein [Spirosoma fluviale]|uniref:Glycosyl transferase family 2 n=1 Tax=Spirosoma fluviale TaxID=1597977 RepID=A0A286FIC7_9BACT|nr:glycosyltransferase [Spirosoma fluviale]SOD82980.1 Glycosyl transferase family 2 [Spirosoma fluviale]
MDQQYYNVHLQRLGQGLYNRLVKRSPLATAAIAYKVRLQRVGQRLYNKIKERPPLVTVVITCYNHGNFLPDAIDSVFQQTWNPVSQMARMENPIEIIVVDDGSTDNTREVAGRYSKVRYIYQENQGLSAARNTGILQSRGDFLIFLDADDWLYPQCVDIGVGLLSDNPTAAFVSGGHDKVTINKQLISSESRFVGGDHYLLFLESNYIGMHATVMYRRTILDEYKFDTSLKACEDYDMYLRIARNHPVLHHPHIVAAYRILPKSMSSNNTTMLAAVQRVLKRQQPMLKDEPEQQAYLRGQQIWIDYYQSQNTRSTQSP